MEKTPIRIKDSKDGAPLYSLNQVNKFFIIYSDEKRMMQFAEFEGKFNWSLTFGLFPLKISDYVKYFEFFSAYFFWLSVSAPSPKKKEVIIETI